MVVARSDTAVRAQSRPRSVCRRATSSFCVAATSPTFENRGRCLCQEVASQYELQPFRMVVAALAAGWSVFPGCMAARQAYDSSEMDC